RSSGCSLGGSVAWKPAAVIGVTIMKMMSNTSITSISGVTLMSALTAALVLATDRATGLCSLLRLEFLGEDRPSELRAHGLDQVVDELFGRVGHLHREEVDLGGEVVVQPHRRHRDEHTEDGRDELFLDARRHGRQLVTSARHRHAG